MTGKKGIDKLDERCWYCNGSIGEIVFKAQAFDGDSKEYSLGECSDCHVVNTLGASNDEIAQAYSPQYYGSSDSKFIPILEKLISYFSRRHAKSIISTYREMQESNKEIRVLDIGCGRGNLLRAFRSLGASVQGIERKEFDPPADLKEVIHLGSIKDANFDDVTFDIVVIWHVIEHIHDTKDVLDEVVRHMNHGSILVIAAPNFGSFQRKVFQRYWFHLDLPRHLIHINRQWLIKVLTARKLEVVSESYFDPTQNIYGFIQSIFNVLFPSKLNRLYGLLNFRSKIKYLELSLWLLFAMLLMPFAVIEGMVNSKNTKGATLTIISRLTN